MENLVEKINLILKTKNISARQFAEEIGVQPSGMSHILSGRNNPSLDFVMKVVRRYPEIDIKWLMFGQGEMLVKGPSGVVTVATSPVVEKAAPKAAATQPSKVNDLQPKTTVADLDLFSQVNENRVVDVATTVVPEYHNPVPSPTAPQPAADTQGLANALGSVATATAKSKHIVRLLAFYDDHTFAEFLPE